MRYRAMVLTRDHKRWIRHRDYQPQGDAGTVARPVHALRVTWASRSGFVDASPFTVRI